MQPTYLPWAGYFNLIASVDKFIFLDDVQYISSAWQNRNRIIINNNPHFLSVPVLRKNLSQKISETEIDDKKNWRKKHCASIQMAYARCPYSVELRPIMDIIQDSSIKKLVDLNVNLVLMISKYLGLSPDFLLSSELKIDGKRTEKVLGICKYLGCTEYISPIGARNYLMEDGHFNNSSILLTFQNFTPRQYPQKGITEFISHLSIVDVIANIGLEMTKDYIR